MTKREGDDLKKRIEALEERIKDLERGQGCVHWHCCHPYYVTYCPPTLSTPSYTFTVTSSDTNWPSGGFTSSGG